MRQDRLAVYRQDAGLIGFFTYALVCTVMVMADWCGPFEGEQSGY